MAGAASLLAVAAAERAGVEGTRRWHLQAVASAVVMFMLMANAMQQPSGDVLWFLVVVGAASTLVAMATSYRDGTGSSIGEHRGQFQADVEVVNTRRRGVSCRNAPAPVRVRNRSRRCPS